MSVPITPRTNFLTQVYAGTSGAAIIIDAVLLSSRFIVRKQKLRRFQVDDWLICAGFIFAVTCWTLQIASVGRYASSAVHTTSDTEGVLMLRLGLAASCSFSIALCCVKTSVLSTLYRIKGGRRWHLIVGTLIVCQLVFTAGDCLYMLVNVRIFTTAGCATDSRDSCQTPNEVLTIVESGFYTLTDLAVSLLPMAFLIQLQRPALEKLSIALLMSMGLVAGACSVWKALIARRFTEPGADIADLTVQTCALMAGEMFLGIFAAGLYGLRSTLLRFFKVLGIDVRALLKRARTKVKRRKPSVQQEVVESEPVGSEYTVYSWQERLENARPARVYFGDSPTLVTFPERSQLHAHPFGMDSHHEITVQSGSPPDLP